MINYEFADGITDIFQSNISHDGWHYDHMVLNFMYGRITNNPLRINLADPELSIS